jgi:hypothetical protein
MLVNVDPGVNENLYGLDLTIIGFPFALALKS